MKLRLLATILQKGKIKLNIKEWVVILYTSFNLRVRRPKPMIPPMKVESAYRFEIDEAESEKYFREVMERIYE